MWAQLGLRIVLSTSLSLLYTMVNSLQILCTFGYLTTKQPANVYYVQNEVQSLAGFELFSPDDFIAYLFPNLSETPSVSSSFDEMKAEGRILIQHLGFFLIGIFLAVA